MYRRHLSFDLARLLRPERTSRFRRSVPSDSPVEGIPTLQFDLSPYTWCETQVDYPNMKSSGIAKTKTYIERFGPARTFAPDVLSLKV